MANIAKDKNLGGYTILEVLIVLAISSVMFIIGATFISGKQETTSFKQGVYELASSIQNVYDQVRDGQYADIPTNCTYSLNLTNISSSTYVNQGTTSNCVFLGKLLEFGIPDAPAITNQYQVYTLAGGRYDPTFSNGNNIIYDNGDYPTLDNSGPLNVVNADPRGVPSLTQYLTIPNGIKVINMFEKDTTTGLYNPAGLSATLGRPGGTPGNPYCGNSWVIGFLKQAVDGNNYTVALQYTLADGSNQDFGGPYGTGIPLASPAGGLSLVQDTNISYTGYQHLMLAVGNADIQVTDGTEYADIMIGDSNNVNSEPTITVKLDGYGLSSYPKPVCLQPGQTFTPTNN